ncbi:unnamed protein product, partial [Meganyctiphanes norvegica]
TIFMIFQRNVNQIIVIKLTHEGYFALSDCCRYNNEGLNKHGHELEFLIDVQSPEIEQLILSGCEISFCNHADAADISEPHVCNRSQRLGTICPSPFSDESSAR